MNNFLIITTYFFVNTTTFYVMLTTYNVATEDFMPTTLSPAHNLFSLNHEQTKYVHVTGKLCYQAFLEMPKNSFSEKWAESYLCPDNSCWKNFILGGILISVVHKKTDSFEEIFQMSREYILSFSGN